MAAPPTDFWKQAPCVRILPPLLAGILIHYYYRMPVNVSLYVFLVAFTFLVTYRFLSLKNRYRLRLLPGIVVQLLFFFIGAFLLQQQDVRNGPTWIGQQEQPGHFLMGTLIEPPVEKPRSWKTTVRLEQQVNSNGTSVSKVAGVILVYFEKKGNPPPVYGQQVLLSGSLTPIPPAANPGGFNYQQYALFHGITHQVFLRESDYTIFAPYHGKTLKQWLLNFREQLLQIIHRYIPGSREAGLAAALLVGYKDELDPSIVQTYSDTGVVHIIAISGLHLGLIYCLLAALFNPLPPRLRWLRALLLIMCLWIFSLLAGAQPSVLRSALMFSFLALGELLGRKSSIYNSMAASILVLLCINPFWLWDVGFQLSYTAVLSILLFNRAVYNWFDVSNKLLDLVWKMNAVTIAAQVLTVPLCIYQFHQFPLLFLLSNAIAVPLSSLILLGEIALCLVAFLPLIAVWLGKGIQVLLGYMNAYIDRVANLPGASWSPLQIDAIQCMLLYLVMIAGSYWLLSKNKKAFFLSGMGLLFFCMVRTFSFRQHDQQQLLIVYQVPKMTAIDLVSGRKTFFTGDVALLRDPALRRRYLHPTRTLWRTQLQSTLPGLYLDDEGISFRGKRILVLHTLPNDVFTDEPFPIDVLVIAGAVRPSPFLLVKKFQCKQVVLSSAVPSFHAKQWKNNCDSLSIPCHDVNTLGAFVMNCR